jgi:hypothetical protein
MKSLWRLWAKSLGEKATHSNQESDRVAILRTLIFTTYLITNLFIIAGVIRHWNDIPSTIPETQEERVLKTNCDVYSSK